jgi:erythromycin esterase-like protein
MGIAQSARMTGCSTAARSIPVPLAAALGIALVMSGACGEAAAEADGGSLADAGSDAGLPPGLSAFAGTDPALPTGDLSPLWDMIGDARIIGLGEEVHTSGGFYAAKHRLIRALVEEHGVRVFAMETPRTRAESLETYLQEGPCDADPALVLRAIFSVFSDDNTAALMRWLCERNQAYPDDRVHFFGFDMQQPDDDRAILVDFLRDYAPAEFPALSAAWAPCSQRHSDDSLTQEAYDACDLALAAIRQHLDEHREELVAAAGEEPYEITRMAVDSWRAWQDQIFYFETSLIQSYDARDAAMAAIFEQLLARHYPTERVVVWAHNLHLAARNEKVQSSFNFTSFGSAIERDFGPQYAPIALIAYRPEVNWIDVGTGPTEIGAQEGSVESRLHALGAPYLILDPASPWLPGDQTQIMNDGGMIIADQFDGVVYLDHSPGMNAVFW